MTIHFFVIHVAEHTERLETFQRRVHDFPKDLFTFEIVDAVVEKPGMEGCRKSHQKIVSMAKQRNLECCWVLEDDVLFASVNTVLHSSNIHELEENARIIHTKNDYFQKLHDLFVMAQQKIMMDDIDYFLGGAHGILHNNEIYDLQTSPVEQQPQRKLRGTLGEIPSITEHQIDSSRELNDYYAPRRPVPYNNPHRFVSFPSSGTHCVCYGSRRAYDAVLKAPPKIHIDVYLGYLTYPHGFKVIDYCTPINISKMTILRSGTIFPFVAIAYAPHSSIRNEECEYKEEMDYFIGAEQRVQYFLEQRKRRK